MCMDNFLSYPGQQMPGNPREPLSQEKPAPAYSPGFLVPSPAGTQVHETAARGGSGIYSAGLFLLSLGPDCLRRLCCWCPITEPQSLHDIQLPAPFTSSVAS